MTDNITLPRQTVQQALEALEAYKNFIDDAYINEGQWHWLNGLDNAQTALKAALEQQAEPVAQSDLVKRLRETASKGVSVWGNLQMEAAREIEILRAERDCYASAMDKMLAASRAKPVAFVNADHLQGLTLGHYGYVEIYTYESAGSVPLYTPPPQREPLTDEQLDEIAVVARRGNLHDLRIAIEAAHCIKEGT